MEPNTLKLVTLILFLATYVLLLILSKYRAYVAAGAAVVFIIIGALPLGQVVGAINWNVLMMIAGTMGTVFFFNESRMPARLADSIIAKTPNVKWAIIALSIFAGIISAFVDNVATVLMVAPIALNIAKKLNISPVKSIIAIAIASNLEGAATLVGDTTSILLGGYAGMNFLDFFVMNGRLGLFWVVQASLIVATLVLLIVFKGESYPINGTERTEVKDYFPTVLLVGTVVSLIVASFLPGMPEMINGIICLALFLLGLVRELFHSKDAKLLSRVIKEIDGMTLLQLAGLFVVIGGITHVGIVDDISRLFVSFTRDPFILYTLLVWGSVLLSAFIDNIPYTATMLPVVSSIASEMGVDPTLFYFGLLIGATLGGNLTPIGASANVAGLGILRKDGYNVSTGTFMKISVPYTLAAVVTGYVLVWIIWR
ncbi:MAG: SLC13 family permease [Oscillospiraceae bacterium]